MKLIKNSTTIQFSIGGVTMVGNQFNGSIIGLDQPGKQFLDMVEQGKDFDYSSLEEEQKELCDSLIECNMYHDANELEEEILALSSAYVHVTNRCNLNCIGCYSRDDKRNKEADLSLEQIKSILKELANQGLQQLVISGGEPFARLDLEDIVKYAKKDLEIEHICIITNGTLVTKERLQGLKGYVDVISVSIDGFSKEHPVFIRRIDIFDQVVSAVRLIKEMGIVANLLPTIHKMNIQFMHEYQKLAQQLECEISYSVLTKNTEEPNEFLPEDDDLIALAEQLKGSNVSLMDTPISAYTLVCRKYCGAGKNIVSVTANGDVYPCHTLHREELKMGNLLKTGLSEIMKNSRFANLDVHKFDTCKDCTYADLCGGGCRCRAYVKNQNLYEKDSYCKMFFEYFQSVEDKLKAMANDNQ